MRRTRELTSIHYRRLVKRSRASLGLRGYCPVCGSALEVIVVDEPEGTRGGSAKPVERTVFRLAREEIEGGACRGFGSPG
jgi:hypothetical protein